MRKNVVSNHPIASANGIRINTELFSSEKNYYTYPARTVKYIVIHYTGNSKDSARNNANYFNTGSRGASAHYFVDDTSIYQSVALKNAAWAVGGVKTYKHAECRNLNSISIEMCTIGNYIVSAKTEINTAYLCAELCKCIGISADMVDMYVLRHYDVWDKACPKGWTGANNERWNTFKARVKAILNGSEVLNMTQYEELKKENADLKSRLDKIEKNLKNNDIESFVYNYVDKNMPDWSKEAVQWAISKGLIKGNDIDINGNPMYGLTRLKLWILTVLYRFAKTR